jgi:hypothetical protein
MERGDVELEASPALGPGDGDEEQFIEDQENQEMDDTGQAEPKQWVVSLLALCSQTNSLTAMNEFCRTRLSQMGFTPMEALQNRLSDAQM